MTRFAAGLSRTVDRTLRRPRITHAGSALGHVKEGRLRVLATLLPKRSPLLPETPTAIEAGLRGLTISARTGLFGPARLSSD